MTNILQVLLGLALINYFMFDVISDAAKPARISRQLKNALVIAGMTAVAFLLTLVSSSLLEKFVLFRFPNRYLSIFFFCLILASVLQFIVPLLLKRDVQFAPVPGILLPLIFANAVVLGVSMPVETGAIVLNEIFAAGVLRCIGFAIVLMFFTVLRERLSGADVAAPLQGAPTTLLTAALVSMMLLGFSGLA
jgi:Na+-translocating ferredoxin:NAD+ oxidoreductase subunit A